MGAEMNSENGWIRTTDQLPPDGVPVKTKIHDADGCRNQQVLVRRGNLWYIQDEGMYVYYTPTHWKALWR